jgi:CheY-like chemotaxis protein
VTDSTTDREPGPRENSPDATGWRKLRVLCVDDHVDSLYILKRLLALQRHEVRTCTTAAEARAALSGQGSERFDLLLCDLTLPDGDGHEIMKEAARLDIPGVALSARTGQREHERSRAAGFVDHLDKPIAYEQLTAAIERVMSRKSDAGGP